MKRRTFLIGAMAGTGAFGFRLPLVHADGYGGRFFVFVQADGGWDPTSFCDPKTNTPGEKVINHWAERDEARQAGNIPYAPFAANAAFFEKYHDRMLVINGVDAQTNSHTVGVVHNWSGRNSEGYPTMTALLAAEYAGDQPVAYLNFGGYSVTADVARFTRLNDLGLIRNIATPHRPPHETEARYIGEPDLAILESYRAATAARLAGARGLLPRQARNRGHYESAFAGAEGLAVFADAIPPDDQIEQDAVRVVDGQEHGSDLRRQAQLAILAFKTGVAVSADLFQSGGDTHAHHDRDQGVFLEFLADGLDYLWDYAEENGVADRLVVVVGSDFGRTNFYNADNGKDHWPIGSYVVMEKNQPWTNRTVGETDALHFAQRINPRTLKRDDANGTIVYPKHVHKALRRYLGIEDSLGARRFPFNNTEDFAFFG